MWDSSLPISSYWNTQRQNREIYRSCVFCTFSPLTLEFSCFEAGTNCLWSISWTSGIFLHKKKEKKILWLKEDIRNEMISWNDILQTFSQVCQFNVKSRAIEVHQAPWTILDQPRFSYRGLLIGEAA